MSMSDAALQARDSRESSQRKRKQRPRYSCADCRRLKLKCDRQVPCSNCVRRGYRKKCVDDSEIKDSTETLEQLNQPDTVTRNQDRRDHAPEHEEASQKDSSRLSTTSQRDYTIEASSAQESEPPRTIYSLPAASDHNTSHLFGPRASPTDQSAGAHADRSVSATYSVASPHWLRPAISPSRRQHSPSSSKLGSGTLVLGRGGTSKYLGPTAASEWLKDSEIQDVGDTAANSRAPSPDDGPSLSRGGVQAFQKPVAFPFNASPARVRTSDLLSRLPPREEGRVLVESYYRYCSWHHDVIPHKSFQRTFDELYDLAPGKKANAQSIALIFIVLAQGTLFNLEMPNVDATAEEWLHLSELALVKGNFLASNTIAGVQTLHLMAHYHLHVDKGNRGDSAWTLWGMCMRMIQAMGMHRDGARWSLPDDVLEERRKVFWECYAADVFQAHCFSRPLAISPNHCDTLYPQSVIGGDDVKDYTLLRFELSQISAEVLNNASNVREPAYSVVTALHDKLCRFEVDLPYGLRCRAAFLATPSRYSDPAMAETVTPEPSRRSLVASFQQSSLALNICETIIWLHRPYYAKALYTECENHQLSVYAPSYLAVIERCATIIAIVTDIHARFPTVAARQWHLWYHTFNSAVCLGTLILRDPRNILADFALTQISMAANVYTVLVQSSGPAPRAVRNLQWLVKLQARAAAKMASAKGGSGELHTTIPPHGEDADSNETDDVELLGWRTRLVERASHNSQSARTIESPRSQMTEDPPSAPDTAHFIQSLLQTAGTAVPGADMQLDTSTDVLLRDFWDPLVLQTSFGAPSSDEQSVSVLNDDAFLQWWGSEGQSGLLG